MPLLRFVTGKFPITPVLSGSPVVFVKTPAEGVPRFGVTITAPVVSAFDCHAEFHCAGVHTSPCVIVPFGML